MADILIRTVLTEKAPIEIVIDNYILQPGDFVSWWYSNYIGHVFSVTNCFNLNIILKLGTKIYDTDLSAYYRANMKFQNVMWLLDVILDMRGQ